VSLGWILIGFSFAMGLGALISWAWIPEVQDARGSDVETRRGKKSKSRDYEVPSKSLEELAVGRIGVLDEKRMVGFRRKSGLLMRRLNH